MATITSIPQKNDLYYDNIEKSVVAYLNNVKVFKNAQLKDEKFNRKKLTPVYSSLWYSPIPLCPYTNGVEEEEEEEEEVIEWMKKLRLLPTEQVEKSVRKIESCYITGYPLCLAKYDYASVFCKCLTLWLLYDDVIVEVVSDPVSVTVPFDVLAGISMTSTHLLNPFVIAFKEIGDEYERLGASRQFRK